MPHLLGSSVSYRIAVGPQQGRKAFMIRTIRPLDRSDPGLERVAKANGFSLHAGVGCEGHQRNKRERLCRYIEDQDTIDRILDHLRRKEQETPTQPLLAPPTRAPPGTLPLFAGKEPSLSQFNQQGRH